MRPEQLEQRSYYARTAAEYDRVHGMDREHAVALDLIASLADRLGAASILDVGSGTGRGIGYFLQRDGSLNVHGVEPVQELIDEAVNSNGVPADAITRAGGEDLPFADNSYDVVIALGVLHHVPDPDRVVAEMARVARRAVCISDNNRFGRGSALSRWTKLVLAKLGLWNSAFRLRTGGKGYLVTEGDGVAYSYSVYDSMKRLANWGDRVQVVSSEAPTRSSWLHPLLTTFHVLLIAERADG